MEQEMGALIEGNEKLCFKSDQHEVFSHFAFLRPAIPKLSLKWLMERSTVVLILYVSFHSSVPRTVRDPIFIYGIVIVFQSGTGIYWDVGFLKVNAIAVSIPAKGVS